MGMALMGVGGLIVVVGGLLWMGNMTGKFPTFPYAGYITIAIGAALFGLGKKQLAEKSEA